LTNGADGPDFASLNPGYVCRRGSGVTLLKHLQKLPKRDS
jgi:hypothetical protein